MMFEEAIPLLSIWASMSSWLTPTFLFLFLNLMIGTIFITSSFSSSSSSTKPLPLNHHENVANHHQQPPPSPLSRAPSVLSRLKSINFYSYYAQNLAQQNLSTEPFTEQMPELERVKVQPQPQFQTRPATELGSSQVPAWVAPSYQNRAQNNQTRTHPTPDQAEPTIQTRTQTSQAWAPPIEEDISDDEGPTLDEIYSRIKGITTAHHNRQNSDTLPMGGDIPVKLPAKIKKSASDKSAFNHFQVENEATEVDERVMIAATVATAVGSSGDEVDSRADDFINSFKKQLQLQRNESILRYKNMITSKFVK